MVLITCQDITKSIFLTVMKLYSVFCHKNDRTRACNLTWYWIRAQLSLCEKHALSSNHSDLQCISPQHIVSQSAPIKSDNQASHINLPAVCYCDTHTINNKLFSFSTSLEDNSYPQWTEPIQATTTAAITDGSLPSLAVVSILSYNNKRNDKHWQHITE